MSKVRVRVTFDEMPREDAPVFAISKAAELADMHPQTLRQYDRLGLVVPQRTAGRGRRYSMRDVNQLIEIQRLSLEEGINLAGIKRILDLESKVRGLESRVELLTAQVNPGSRIFAAGTEGEVVSVKRFAKFRGRGTATEPGSKNDGGLHRRRSIPLQLTATVEDIDELESVHSKGRAIIVWTPDE